MAKVVGKNEKLTPRADCRGCGSIVEYAHNEIKWGDFNCDWLGDCDHLQYIDCPNCSYKIKV